MNKVNPNDVAKWFRNQGIIEDPNSKEGNMKVQKLLFFAQLIYMAENNGQTMFDEEFKAFKDGVVLESVMQNYRYKYNKMFSNVNSNELNIDSKLEDTLEKTKAIFGKVSAQELSELSHEFEAWDNYYKKSYKLGFHIKDKSIIPYEELRKELDKIKEVLDAYEQTSKYKDVEVEDY